ncbi:MAG: oxygen-independent coproporphyrinogen III oxidase [Bacteroidota bacterium]|nr:oxygen-independent coproporphyrinogen III oxidase [Bacteroidota bacterium]
MIIPKNLLEKYNVPVPRYTSYPPANFFSESFSREEFRQSVIDSNHESPQNISIYLHLPFCPQQCFYCGCNTHISHNRDLMRSYVDALKKEIDMMQRLLDHTRKVSQIHLGGGTPNFLPVEYIGELIGQLKSTFSLIDKPEIAIECNPANLDQHYIEQLIRFGFNRFSLGVQDFEDRVLKTVNREIPHIPIDELTRMIKSNEGTSVNLDFIYGLPYQTKESFIRNIEKALEIRSDRMVTFSYAHVPWFKSAQKILEKSGLPNADQKLEMFGASWSMLKGSGYVPIGLDHYALETDELSIALKNRKLHRNFQGYCTRETTGQVYAFGSTSISQMESAYAQNVHTVESYIETINRGELATEKGYKLSVKEKITRHIINEIMCNQYLSLNETANAFGITFGELKNQIPFQESQLEAFHNDGLLDFNGDELHVSETGRFFMRNIAATFDSQVTTPDKKFSKAV